ncbi:MAG: DNA helicase [Chloroflexi bacterium]|nr:MAG: DNA helicase [Chloroflexota bacterium]
MAPDPSHLDALEVRPDALGRRAITPTDVSQFIRLDQCRRYLRLRLFDRAHRREFDFMYAADVTRQSIPPLLTRSGARFEQATEATVPSHIRVNLATERLQVGGRPDDNARVLQLLNDLRPGETRMIFQPRLIVHLGAWTVRGDIDILRCERDQQGQLHLLIADMKSSTSAKVEHRLQVAFYHEMLVTILAAAGVAHAPIELGVLYRGPASDDAGLTEEIRELHAEQRAAARELLWAENGLLEIIEQPDQYIGSVHELVTAPRSTAQEVVDTPFEALPWHLTYKCDGCIYNEYCMKWAASHDDLSLLPHLSASEKTALHSLGLRTTKQLVELRVPSPTDPQVLLPAPGKETLNRQVATTWPVGPRIDELVHRARAYRRFKGDDLSTVTYLPHSGHGSLPYCDPQHNPNLVRIYIDAQHDYLHDRVYLLGALLTGCEHGEEVPSRRATVVRMTNGPPTAPLDEERLFLNWISDVLAALRAIAAPDDAGGRTAPVHLIFFDAFAQKVVLDGLARHFGKVVGATPLYDFMTQLAAFDSPVVSLLEQEIRTRRNFPMVCQSLQAVAAFLGFDWRSPDDYRAAFRARMFDFWGALGEDEAGRRVDWYTSRARFNSQVPLEYAYAAWGDLERSQEPGARGDYTRYRAATIERVLGFAARRLEAIEHITRGFHGNEKTTKTAFDLSTLDQFVDRAGSLAEAIHLFVTTERHVELNDWKRVRLLPPERRVLAGETLLVRYVAGDQDPGVAEENAEHLRRQQLREQYEAQLPPEIPGEPKPKLSSAQYAEVRWDATDMEFLLRICTDEVGAGIEEILALSGLSPGDWVVIYPRWTMDGRLLAEERTPFQPTPKQMLYGMRGEILSLDPVQDTAGGLVMIVRVKINRPSSTTPGGFLFGAFQFAFVDGETYSLDPDPNDINGFWQNKVVEGLLGGGRNTLYQRLLDLEHARVDWPEAAVAGQRRFLQGLEALHAAGLLHPFGPAQRDYIGGRGNDPVLLVQGPPGTGKSYSTAFAVFARFQGALAAGQDMRILASCKTHAATDVLLLAVHEVLARLHTWQRDMPQIFERFFDQRLLDIPLFRLQPRGALPEDIRPLYVKSRAPVGQAKMLHELHNERWCFVASTPGGIYRMMDEAFTKRQTMFGHDEVDCLILDEASQMSLPEAIMAALPLKQHGQLIIVGDHRQMPPIVKHDWAGEPRRTFQEFKSYQSLFETFREKNLKMVQFEESFRLHRDMAEFLRREIYVHDGIPFHARHTERLAPIDHPDPLVRAVLDPDYPLVVIVHDEARSQQRNPFEQALITPLLQALADAFDDPEAVVREHLGVVVPHRAQRAAVQSGVPEISLRDPLNGFVELSAVDTVERFQGGERTAILVSATESDPEYLLVSNKFLLDPRRLTVALSRAKRKLVLVAARSVFNVFSTDEEAFQNAQIWKNLLRHTCTEPLWAGQRVWEGDQISIEVWGKHAAAPEDTP